MPVLIIFLSLLGCLIASLFIPWPFAFLLGIAGIALFVPSFAIAKRDELTPAVRLAALVNLVAMGMIAVGGGALIGHIVGPFFHERSDCGVEVSFGGPHRGC